METLGELEALDRARANAAARLLAARDAQGSWPGELSSSALSTATAALALELHARAAGAEPSRRLAARGRAWLAAHPNADGGFGDTLTSPSNLATTALAWAALGLGEEHAHGPSERLRRAEARLAAFTGGLEPARLSRALLGAYGDDRTFSVPIGVACALAGGLGAGREPWALLPAIPFELAALPRGLFHLLGLPMVSYALPALIAIGQVLHHRAPSGNPLARLARSLASAPTLRTLRAIQPASGGYLEATPLTSFVVASLIGCGRASHPVVSEGVRFLAASVRPDGSWPIDTNLATWLTSLAVEALAAGCGALGSTEERARTRAWLERQQFRRVHPYTGAAPGGWAWTDRSGGVPDADDTSGALLALERLAGPDRAGVLAGGGIAAGVRWLVELQNRDGGVPTFCRGWSGLPFDRSAADLSAHALRALGAWQEALPPRLAGRVARSRARIVAHLVHTQRADGSWVPLWFGNQHDPALENPLYGTTRVLAARAELAGSEAAAALARAEGWLLGNQDGSGGFGGRRGLPPTIEETALGLRALAELPVERRAAADPGLRRALAWLLERTDQGRAFEAAPIGLYFAKLWYAEALYPVIFTVAALASARGALAPAPRALPDR